MSSIAMCFTIWQVARSVHPKNPHE
jgi:hypothetical protein